MRTYYDTDLAHIHDTRYAELAQAAAEMIWRTLSGHGFEKGLVVDLGCGSGIVAEKLIEAHFEVLGIDQSKELIKRAKKRAPKATFLVESLFDTVIPPCLAVVSTGECFNYLFDERNNKEVLQTLFQKVFNALTPHGLFIFDMIEPGVAGESGEYSKILEGPDWMLFLHVVENKGDSSLTRDITVFRKKGKNYAKSSELHRVQLYPHEQVVSLLKKIGFQVSLFHKYGTCPLRQHHVGFLCQKKS